MKVSLFININGYIAKSNIIYYMKLMCFSNLYVSESYHSGLCDMIVILGTDIYQQPELTWK